MEEKPERTVTEDYLKNLEKKVVDLKTLMEVSAIISSTLDFDKLINVVMERAKDVMGADACSILLYNRNTGKLDFEVALCDTEETSEILRKKVSLDLGQGIAGWVAQNLKPVLIADARKDSRYFHEADRHTGFTTKSLIAVPLSGREGLIGVAEIMNPRGKGQFTEYDMELFQALCRQVAVAIENSIFHRESIERERLRQELEIASSIQKSFLPGAPVFRKAGIKVSAINISAKQVGGDLYDFTEPADGKAGVLIGDISGKGVYAALYMAKIISDFRFIARKSESPEAVMNELNRLVYKAPRGIFLTAVYMIADAVTGGLKISSAGHPPFIWLSGNEVRVMDVQGGPPLGTISYDYPSSEILLKKGDRLILITDGVFDARNKDGQRLGFENLVKFIEENIKEQNLPERIIGLINGFSRGVEAADDTTLVEVSFSG